MNKKDINLSITLLTNTPMVKLAQSAEPIYLITTLLMGTLWVMPASHTRHNKEPKTIKAIIERAATQSLVRIDAFSVSVQIGVDLFYFYFLETIISTA